MKTNLYMAISEPKISYLYPKPGSPGRAKPLPDLGTKLKILFLTTEVPLVFDPNCSSLPLQFNSHEPPFLVYCMLVRVHAHLMCTGGNCVLICNMQIIVSRLKPKREEVFGLSTPFALKKSLRCTVFGRFTRAIKITLDTTVKSVYVHCTPSMQSKVCKVESVQCTDV